MAGHESFRFAESDEVILSTLSAGKAATGYSLVLPPGWRKIPLRGGTNKAVRAIVKEIFAEVAPGTPQDRVTAYRAYLEKQLSDMVREAKSKGGIDLYLPVKPVYRAPLAASFVVSEMSLGEVDPADILATLVAEDDAARPVVVDGGAGARIDRIVAPIPERGVEVSSRSVEYVLPVPGSADRWMVIAFSTLGGGSPDDEITRLLCGLFQAIMANFRWGWKAS
jgi:hypothetical protein